jgi:nucleotide-binding universal stress UspA family protein
MYKNILLCTDGSPTADNAAAHAVALAGKLRARITALYVTDIRVLEGPLLSDISGALGAQTYNALLPQLEQIQREKADALLQAVKKRCADAQIECAVAHETGTLIHKMLDYERKADLVVLGRQGENAKWLEDALGSSVERMVRASVKPCLVTPGQFRPIEHILLAHDGSAESTKALRAGIGLAGDLGVGVTIITVCQKEGEEAAATKILKDAQQQAAAAKLSVHGELGHGHAESEILRVCEEVGAELIVMGAYGHTRIRELVLGSTTSQVLTESHVPVLLFRG